MHFENCQPILRVEDMARALHFYVDLLGFRKVTWSDDDFASIYRDQAPIFLCRQDQGRGGAWIWIGVDDVHALYAHLLTQAVKIRMSPTLRPWAWELHVEDPDGNVIRFGSEPI
ncbi:MAG: VOC family protein [Bryobacteraceae bacterium]|nr:VOC family protein [Bryobacteraceae bacterium]